MRNVEVLNIFLSQRLIGQLFRFDNGTTTPIIRFVAEDHFAVDTQQAILSLSMLARYPDQQASLWKDVSSSPFNGHDGRLEKPCVREIKETVSKAYALWPDLIANSLMHASQKDRLLARLKTHRFAGNAN